MSNTVTELEVVRSDLQDTSANNIVKNHVISSFSLALVPVPLFDVAALITTQLNMIRSLAIHYETPFDNLTKAVVVSLITGALPVAGIVGLSSCLKLIPGIGSLFGSASLSITAASITYAVGQTFIMHFEAGGTIDDFDPKRARAFFLRELESGKKMVISIREEFKRKDHSDAHHDNDYVVSK